MSQRIKKQIFILLKFGFVGVHIVADGLQYRVGGVKCIDGDAGEVFGGLEAKQNFRLLPQQGSSAPKNRCLTVQIAYISGAVEVILPVVHFVGPLTHFGYIGILIDISD